MFVWMLKLRNGWGTFSQNPPLWRHRPMTSYPPPLIKIKTNFRKLYWIIYESIGNFMLINNRNRTWVWNSTPETLQSLKVRKVKSQCFQYLTSKHKKQCRQNSRLTIFYSNAICRITGQNERPKLIHKKDLFKALRNL